MTRGGTLCTTKSCRAQLPRPLLYSTISRRPHQHVQPPWSVDHPWGPPGHWVNESGANQLVPRGKGSLSGTCLSKTPPRGASSLCQDAGCAKWRLGLCGYAAVRAVHDLVAWRLLSCLSPSTLSDSLWLLTLYTCKEQARCTQCSGHDKSKPRLGRRSTCLERC